MKSARQLKSLIRIIAKEKNINAQILLRNYMLERLLERIVLSEYKDDFILKGSMLIAAMIGIPACSTMTMDTTIKAYPANEEAIMTAFQKILLVPIDDGVTMLIKSIVQNNDEYEFNGFHIELEAIFESVRLPLKVDITIGDTFIIKGAPYKFHLLVEEKYIDIWAYNIETILAQKLETILSRSTANTQMRDFYDIYVLSISQKNSIDSDTLLIALDEIAAVRQSYKLLSVVSQILYEINESKEMQNLWKSYCKKYRSAANILWQEVMDSIYTLFNYNGY